VKGAAVTGVAIALFAALVAWMTLREAGASCEVCMAWNDRVHCAAVRAASLEEAETRARASACSIVTDGMADELACQRSAARSTRCTEE
jgi:hypothetical protein